MKSYELRITNYELRFIILSLDQIYNCLNALLFKTIFDLNPQFEMRSGLKYTIFIRFSISIRFPKNYRIFIKYVLKLISICFHIIKGIKSGI